MKCKVCNREGYNEDFCALHLEAYKNIVDCYSDWRKALATSWREYLSQIAKNSLTGTWVKEVAEYLIDGETHNVGKS
jgi:hypothetical protein